MTSINVKPAGSFVVFKNEASSAFTSPAAKCVSPFCVGKPAFSICALWYGMNTNRPSASIIAFAPEMAKFTSEKAFVCTLAPLVVDRVCDLTLLFYHRHIDKGKKDGVRERERRVLVVREKHKRARDNILSRARRGFFFFQFFLVSKSVSPRERHIFAVVILLLLHSLSLFITRAREQMFTD